MSGGGDQGGAPKTLYVGNLDNNVTEDLILASLHLRRSDSVVRLLAAGWLCVVW